MHAYMSGVLCSPIFKECSKHSLFASASVISRIVWADKVPHYLTSYVSVA